MNDIAALALQDDAARADALDITRSWLVQAPAGSGKTALLIQRFLALLASVERPERIVATTFTRKAAGEMRERILEALRDAADPHAPVPDAPHEALTRRLARAALGQDRRMDWRLLEQPARLRIVTIDALAAALARQAPLTAGLGALPGFVDDALALYREAARAALAAAPAGDAAWQTFLQWQDNDAKAAAESIAQMLAARDRWPGRMFREDDAALRADMERALAWEARVAVQAVARLIPAALAASLPALARLALAGFDGNGSRPACAPALAALARDGTLPDADARDLWCGLADWLLARNGAFLRKVTIRQGFPPAGKGPGANERAEGKARMERWLVDAGGVPGLADAWQRLREMPPAHFDDPAWAFVVAAMRILPRAAQALADVFAARGQADFTEATLRALVALGSDEHPSDLLLAIDYRLAHLLVDEFQDTSAAQLALIGRLTDGWEPGDGRTVFIVGDPMQSIYRFREAEVALFLAAQASKTVGNVPVGVLELTRNFRSQPALVAWANEVFAAVLPAVSDASRSEAAHRPAYPACADTGDGAPTIDLVTSRDEEGAAVVRRIKEARAAGMSEIAVLVRARSHAQALLPALRREGIEYSAVELEALHDRLATRDLLALARALAQPRDRLAWLAILHAPWCGLGLADLLAIAAGAADDPIVEAIAHPEVIAQLTAAGRTCVARLREAVEPALAARGEASFAARVRGAWLALGGPACASSALDRDGADRIFALLAAHEHGGDVPDFASLFWTAERLYAEAGSAQTPPVQVMTLHRAKGLEFDAVILPGLDQASGHGDVPLIRTKVRDHDGARTLVLAPLRARVGARSEDDPVYAWLGRLDAAEEAAELGRLLYVGATRAKRRLHLLAVAAVNAAAAPPCWKSPPRTTALGRLWDALGDRIPPPPDLVARAGAAPATLVSVSEFSRLPLDWRLPALPPPLPIARQPALSPDEPAFDWADAIAAVIGTCAHRLLAQIAVNGLDAWDERRVRDELPRIVAELGSEGVEPQLRGEAARRVADVVGQTLRDPRGRWLFDPAHGDARSEWALAGESDGRIVHVVVDRSFVADGRRYIVDFKTGAHLGGDPAAFLAREFERYEPQLMRYARIVRGIDPRPLRIALYHPLVPGGWQQRDVPPEG